MSKGSALLQPLREIIPLLVSEARQSDDDVKMHLILQTKSIFSEILVEAEPTSSYVEQILDNSRNFFRLLNESITVFFTNGEMALSLVDLLSSFMNSKINASFGQEISTLIISLLYSNFLGTPSEPAFFKLMQMFFSNSVFPPFFEAFGGLLSLWDLLLASDKSSLCDIVFDKLSTTIHLYFQSKATQDALNFLSHTSKSISDLPSQNAPNAFQFLFDLISNSKADLLTPFIEFNGFVSINNLIIKNDDPQLLIVYQMFRSMIVFRPNSVELPPIVQQLAELIDTKSASSTVRTNAMTILFNTVRQLTDKTAPLQPHQLYTLALNLDPQTSAVYFDMCFYIATHFDIDLTTILTSLTKTFTVHNALNYNYESLFKLFQLLGDKFQPFASLFFTAITNGASVSEFAQLANKYPEFLTLLPLCFIEAGSSHTSLFSIFIRSGSMLNKEEDFQKIMSKVIQHAEMVQVLIDKLREFKEDTTLLNMLLNSLINAAVRSADLRKALIEYGIISVLNELSNVILPDEVFDTCAVLAGKHFDVVLDATISQFLKVVDFLGQKEESILKLAFGLRQNEVGVSGRLCFPSILYKCSKFEITSPYDLYLCAQYAIDPWMKETGKTIDQFPSINHIARRYLLPHHVTLLFDYPKIFADALDDSFGVLPLFEFPKDFWNSQITIKLGNECKNGSSISFWFFFKDFPASSQMICTYQSICMFAAGDELFANDQQIGEFKLNRWYHASITVTEKGKATYYLDGKSICHLQATYAVDAVLGSKEKNASQWFFGGAIRVFDTAISDEVISKLMQMGVSSVFRYGLHEVQTYWPNFFIDLFEDANTNLVHMLGENSRPVPSFPLSAHLVTAYGGSSGLFEKILKLVAEDKNEDAKYYILGIAYLQLHNNSNWTNVEFSLHLSSLFSIDHTLFDSAIFNKVMDVFSPENKEIFDWEAFLVLFMDYSILNSEFASYFISKLFGFIAQFPPNEYNDFISNFLYFAAQIIDFNKDDLQAIIALIKRIDIPIDQTSRYLASLSDFKENISNPRLKYCVSDESPLYYPLIDVIMPKVNTNFQQSYLFHILPATEAFDLLTTVISGKKMTISPTYIMRFCINYCYVPKAWSIALSLLTQTKIDVEISLDFPKQFAINAEVLSEFFIMLSILLTTSCKMPEVSYWVLLSNKLLDLINSFVNDISLSDINDKFKFALLQLTAFGALSQTITLFPFAPQVSEVSGILEVATKPGQPFEQGEPKPCPFPTFQMNMSDSHIADRTYNQLLSVIPKTIKITKDISVPLPFDKEICKQAVLYNNTEQWHDWPDFVHSIRHMFGVEHFEIDLSTPTEQKFVSEIIKFNVQLLVNAIPDPILFQNLIKQITITNTSFNPHFSLRIMSEISLGVLLECNEKKKFSHQLIVFVCQRISEGWFSEMITPTIKMLLAVCSNAEKPYLPEPLINILIAAYDLIPSKELELYIHLLSENANLIFTKQFFEKLSNIILFIQRITSRYSCLPKDSKIILSVFVEKMKQNDEIANKWNKAILGENPELEFKLIIEGLTTLLEKGTQVFENWKSNNVLVQISIDSLMQVEQDKFDARYRKELQESLVEMSNDRIQQASQFFDKAHLLLFTIHDDITISKSIASCLRYRSRQILLLNIQYFLRLRENLLTSKYHFSCNQNKVKAISILNDPLYPTRRIENSPLVYQMPEFPGGNVINVQPPIPEIIERLVLLPEPIKNLMTLNLDPYEDIVFHSDKQLQLAYSQSLPVTDQLMFQLLQIILNNGEKFDNMWGVSFLYGMEPLPGVLFRSSDKFFFVEGLALSENGVHFNGMTMQRILYTFYISYFISGHFGECCLFDCHPVITWTFDQLISAQEHYWLHKTCAIEIVALTGWNFILIPEIKQYKSLLSLFKKITDDSLSALPHPTSGLSPLISVHMLRRGLNTKQWLEGQIDNYTYLCLLNRFSRRSYCDYTQYFVFPWVISDYVTPELNMECEASYRPLSLPMGQVGPERAPRFDVIYTDSDCQYFYGTHYMHLGVVLYYMFRIDPYCLFSIFIHHGWDHQNRLFYDLKETWLAAAYTSPADVKEMIPQFFTVPEILENGSDLPLTTTTEGKEVATVKYGGWSSNTQDFTRKMMNFLQCDHVTKDLCQWIDLIFGYKSRGEAAIEAKNIFHPLSYVHEKDEDATESEDQIERDAAVTCVINFGQCCFQLFKSPHQAPTKPFLKKHLLSDTRLIISQRLNPAEFTFPIEDIRFVGKDIKFTNNKALLLPPSFGTTISVDFCRQCILAQYPNKQTRALIGANFIISTSCIAVSSDGVFLGVGQREGSVALYMLKYNSNEIIDVKLINRFITSKAVSDCAISSEHFLMIAACKDDINRFDIGTRRANDAIHAGFKINCLAIDDYGALIIAGGYKQLSVWSISGTPLMSSVVEGTINKIVVANLPETSPNRFFVTGDSNGVVKFWTLNFTDNTIDAIETFKLGNSPVKAITIDENTSRILIATNDSVYTIDFVGSLVEDLDKKYAIQCSQCANIIEKGTQSKICANCHRFFCHKCLKQEIVIKLPKINTKKQQQSQPAKKYLCPQCRKLKKKQNNDL